MSGNRSGRFWLITAAAVTGIAVTLALGIWQMSRAAQKLALHAAIEQRQALAPVSQGELLASRNPADLLHRTIVLRGSWVGSRTVFLDNRQMQARIGFYVVTPLRLEGSDAAVLVQRGWAPRNFVEREKLPPVTTPEGVVEVRGRLAPPPAKLYEFAGAAPGPIRQNLDLAQFRAETGLPLLALSVQQLGEPSEGLLREWPEPASSVATNYGYAAQWWALSILIAILYVWFQFVAPRRKVPHA
ncbi:MAG: cytochrome oxidase complex biosis factor-like protein [Ramlibacter sp.]|nr:cytochrome oxidase complex biosis factor-like protein [Ramlibacter sp.]